MTQEQSNLMYSSSILRILSLNELIHVLSFLQFNDVNRVLITSKESNTILADQACNQILRFSDKVLVNQITSSLLSFNISLTDDKKRLCRLLYGVSGASTAVSVNPLHLTRIRQSKKTDTTPGSSGIIERGEGHTASILLNRYMVIINAWGGPFTNHLTVLDLTSIASSTIDIIDTSTAILPVEFSYGFSAVPYISPYEFVADPSLSSSISALSRRIIVYGGCRDGGYSNQSNYMYYVDVDFNCENGTNVTSMTANYSQIVRYKSSFAPTVRGYHTSTVVNFNDSKCMVVFGGISNGRSTAELECFDMVTETWTNAKQMMVSGKEPSSRFGHSAVYHNESDRIIITGGSNGSDLIRNGVELADIHILSIVRGNVKNNVKDTMVWSKVTFPGEKYLHYSIIPGRCHSACLIGDSIFYFGGGASNSKLISILQLDSDANNMTIKKPSVYIKTAGSNGVFCGPVKRVSSVAVSMGSNVVLAGGFSNKFKELDDLWLFDLAFSCKSDSKSGDYSDTLYYSGDRIANDHMYEEDDDDDFNTDDVYDTDLGDEYGSQYGSDYEFENDIY